MPEFENSERVVFVTGASGNLGQAIVEAFNAAGCRLIAVDNKKGIMPHLYPGLAASKDAYLAEGVDVTDPEQVQKLVRESIDRFKRIDVLVNTVGGYRAGTPVHETDLETWDYMMDLNARSVLVVCREVIPHMLSQGGGRIINIASSAALKGSTNSAAYSAAKSAVARLTESMAAEYKRKGINVNAIIPGTIDTPQNREAMPDADYSRWIPPQALARVILFLASQDAEPINGVLLPVSGKQ